MKKIWKLRLLFIFTCCCLALYLGCKESMPVTRLKHSYPIYPLAINEVMTDNRNRVRDEDGDFESWIEIYNNGDKAISLQGFGLSDDPKQPFKWSFPSVSIEPKDYLLVWMSGKNKVNSQGALHTSFKLRNKDKMIILTEPNKDWKDIFVFEEIGENLSYGRKPDGSEALFGFDVGTPGWANTLEPLAEGAKTRRMAGPEFSAKGGFYTQEFKLNLTTTETNAQIYYTLDGSVPTTKATQYTHPLLVSSKPYAATVVRARVYKAGYPCSEIITQSYFVDQDIFRTYNTPVISLVTDPDNLFGYENGIYVGGKILDQWKKNNPEAEITTSVPANYNQRGKNWEREVCMELYEADGTQGLYLNIGIRTHGGGSRADNLKSLALFADKAYAKDAVFSYDFFKGGAMHKYDQQKITQFSKLLLRTSSTDSKYSFFRDALAQSLVQQNKNLDKQSSLPSIVFINGVYYGIHNIREAYDENYISDYYDIDPDNVVIIKNPTGIAGVEVQEGNAGDEMHYNRVIDYITQHNLKENKSYKFVQTQIDVVNYMQYAILQIYCDNKDWPGNNASIWRKRTKTYEPHAPYGQDGRWRWLVFDLDFGFGLHQGAEAAKNNSLARAVDAKGPDWPNPPWSTFLLRSLLENDEFKNQFINGFADQLNTNFSTEAVTEKIEIFRRIYYPNVKTHIWRWNLHQGKIENWLFEINDMKKFAIDRPSYLRQYMCDYFDLQGMAEIGIEMSKGGSLQLNSLNLEQVGSCWEGIYFMDVPITLKAVPKPGYTFKGWEGVTNSQDSVIQLTLSQDSYIRAVFTEENNN